MPVTIDGTSGITTPMYNGTITANAVTPSVNMKNRIINGAMVIDQRNAGASVNNIAGSIYTLDRWDTYGDQSAKFSVQQNAGSVTPPTGFTNYLGVTSLSAYTVGASEIFRISQQIEGFNAADLAWGTANAQTVTLSFWVRSSLTGTFGGSLVNSSATYNYPFSYTISAANTWERKSITITGATSGTWNTTNGIGVRLIFGLGVGSSLSAAAGAWTTSIINSSTGATSVVGTNGATFYITGCQLEIGSTATSFDYRPYTTELQLCQRYYVKAASGLSGNGIEINSGWYYSNTHISFFVVSPVPMRTNPTLAATSGTDYYIIYRNGTSDTFDSIVAELSNATNTMLSCYNASQVSGTAGQAGIVRTYNASASVTLTAEL